MAAMTNVPLIMRPGVDPHRAPHKPPLPSADYRRTEEQGLLIERNLSVPLRDGTRIYVDLYRPASRATDLPLLLGWSPYGKHSLTNRVFWPASGVNPDWLSTLTAFEAPDPVFWGSHGYAVAFADPARRGAAKVEFRSSTSSGGRRDRQLLYRLEGAGNGALADAQACRRDCGRPSLRLPGRVRSAGGVRRHVIFRARTRDAHDRRVQPCRRRFRDRHARARTGRMLFLYDGHLGVAEQLMESR